jgi:hypothetical protein
VLADEFGAALGEVERTLQARLDALEAKLAALAAALRERTKDAAA